MSELTRPSGRFAAVTPSNATNIDLLNGLGPRALFVGVGGDVVVVGWGDNAVTFKNVPSGSVLPVQAKRVNSTSTTATDIVALY